MISFFVGQLTGIDDGTENWGSIRGNGKDMSMVYYLNKDAEEGRAIFTNFYTTFSTQLPAQKIVDEITKNPLKYKKNGVSVGLTELSTVLNSLGSSAAQVKFLSYWVQQTRKTNTDVYGNLQRFVDLHPRFRNAADYVLRPVKIHADLSICWYDDISSCEYDEHFIQIYSLKPLINEPITGNDVIVCSEVGKLYNTDEIVYDEIIIPKKNKKENLNS